MLYQQKTSPDEVLKLILNHAEAEKSGSSKKMEQAIDNILQVIDNPSNKNILLLGHCKPDGDTLAQY